MREYTNISVYAIQALLLLFGVLQCAMGDEGYCSVPNQKADSNSQPLYWKVTNPTLSPEHLQDLPGFTRTVIKRDHAVITPESHVFSPLPDWTNTLGAYLITPAMGSHFVMYLANMQDNSKSALPPRDVERFLFVVMGSVVLSNASGISHRLLVDSYAYLPANFEHSLKCDTSATLVIFERRYSVLEKHISELIVGSTDKQPLLETPGEVFELRKLLPVSAPYDFNIHIMDFQPGEYLNVKEVHYNQHGLLLLEGQGIYCLGDSWIIGTILQLVIPINGIYEVMLLSLVASRVEELSVLPIISKQTEYSKVSNFCSRSDVLCRKYPVQAGDVIWMAPFVPQWYAALGKTRSRYLLYKDVNRNPLNS